MSTDNVLTSFNWSKATVDDISSYSCTADVELRSINVPGGLMCRDMHCHDVHHLESIDLFYSDICNALAHSFRKHVSVSHNKKVCTLTKVDDRVGDKEITDMWRNQYPTLLNSVHSSIDKDRVLSYLNHCSSEHSAISISVDDVSNGLKLVKLSKSCCVDGLSVEHFIYAGNSVKVYISILLTSFISHGYLLDSFMKSEIIPLIKIKPETPTTKTTIDQLY